MRVEYTLKNGVKIKVEKKKENSTVISIDTKSNTIVIDDVQISDLKTLANLISLISRY